MIALTEQKLNDYKVCKCTDRRTIYERYGHINDRKYATDTDSETFLGGDLASRSFLSPMEQIAAAEQMEYKQLHNEQEARDTAAYEAKKKAVEEERAKQWNEIRQTFGK